MNIHFKLWIGPIFLFVLLAQNGLAQNQLDNNFTDSVKVQVTSFAKENKALMELNKELKVRLIALQLEIEQYEREIKLLESEHKSDKDFMHEQDAMSQKSQMSTKELEDEMLIEEAQGLYLSGQFMDLDVQQKLEELRLYDLQYQKQELELDFKEKQVLYEKVEKQRRQELDAIQGKIRKNHEKEERFLSKVRKLEKASTNYSQEIELLTIENKALKEKINRLQNLILQ